MKKVKIPKELTDELIYDLQSAYNNFQLDLDMIRYTKEIIDITFCYHDRFKVPLILIKDALLSVKY